MRKRALSLLLSTCLALSVLIASAMAADYTDVSGHWAEDAIARWSDANIVNGVGEAKFNPNGNMSRAEAATVFANLFQLTEKADISAFADVPADAWYADALAMCVEKGIMNGVGADAMDPNGTITREMFFVMFARAMGIAEDTALKDDFADAGSVSDWAKGYVYALINEGYVSGVSSDSIAPLSEINRASVMTLMDKSIAAYVVDDGEVQVDRDGLVIVLAENVTLSGEASVNVVVAEKNAAVSLKGMVGEVQVTVLEDKVVISDAPAGAKIEVAEGVADVTANGTTVPAGEDTVIPDAPAAGGGGGGASGGSSGGGGGSSGGGSTVSAAKKAVKAAWEALDKALKQVTGHDGAQILTARVGENNTYTLLLDADAIQAQQEAFDAEKLAALASAVQNALEPFGDYTLTMYDQVVYENGAFQNTALKNALFSVADGFFYTLGNMTDADNDKVYLYKTIPATATGTDSYTFNIDMQLTGNDVAKVQKLAATLADHLEMEKLSDTEIANRYGVTGISENEAVVVTMEMPDALMRKAAEVIKDVEDKQGKFEMVPIGTYLGIMAQLELTEEILGSGATEISSVLATVNSNADLINAMLDKMTVSVSTLNAKAGGAVVKNTPFFAEDATFTPGTTGDAYQKFMTGVSSMISGTVKEMTPAEFKVTQTGKYQNVYYAVPVTVGIDLDSIDFSATETVIVVLHIDFSMYPTTPAPAPDAPDAGAA